MFITKAVKFNLKNKYQKELYDFCNEQSTNFSGFVKTVLFLYMNSYKQEKPSNTCFNNAEDFIKELL